MGAIIRTLNSFNGDVTAYYSNSPINYSILDIKNLLSNFVLKPHYRIYLLNPDETIKQNIPEEDILSGGSYSENYQSGQRKSLSLDLYNESGKYTPSINGIWVSNKVMLEVGVEDNKGYVVWFRKGIFTIDSASPTHSVSGNTVSVSLSDKFSVLESKKAAIKHTYEIPADSDIESVINDLLATDTGDGYKLDPKQIILHSSLKGCRTIKTISKEVGATIGSIILEIANMISSEVFYNSDGFLTIIPYNEVTIDSDKQIVYQFYEENGDFGNSSLDFNFDDIVNCVIVIGNSVDGSSCKATATNDDPTSPLCYQRIGYRTADPINDSDITSEFLAQERADYELRKKLIIGSSVSIATFFNPILDVNSIVGVTDKFFGFEQEHFLIQSISYSLDYSPSMNITVSNLNNFAFLTKGGANKL